MKPHTTFIHPNTTILFNEQMLEIGRLDILPNIPISESGLGVEFAFMLDDSVREWRGVTLANDDHDLFGKPPGPQAQFTSVPLGPDSEVMALDRMSILLDPVTLSISLDF